MNTTTQTPPRTEAADRFRCASDVPDPPRDAVGRKQYWEDTVAEAVAELRRRLASSRDEKSFQALQMILDLEKTRIRHKEPVAGTKVETRWSGLGSMEDSTSSGGKYQGPKAVEAKTEDLTPPALASRDREGVASLPPAEMPLPGGRGSPDNAVPSNTPSPERGGGRGVGSSTSPPKPARPIPLRERVKLQSLHKGVIGHFHDHDDDYLLERRQRRQRDDAYAAELDEQRDREAVRKAPPPPPLPRSKDLCIISLRENAPDEPA